MTDVPPSLLEWTVDLARTAGAMAADAFRKGFGTVERKADGSVVSEADRAVESFLRERIAAACPHDGILGEEYGEEPGSSGRRWIVDPIDGTEAFVHGVAEFCTMIALEDADGVALGVIDVPVIGETIWARRAGGVFRNGSPIRMSARRSTRGAYVATSDLEDWPGAAVAAALATELRLRTWGGGYGVGLAVSGSVDAFIDFKVDVWDVAPAVILASEAGGVCTALDGSTRLDGGAFLVAGRALHSLLLELVTEDVA